MFLKSITSCICYIKISCATGAFFACAIYYYQITLCHLPRFSRRRSIYVPVINLQSCVDYYRQHDYELTDDYLCTLDSSGEKGCTYEDGGSALVVGFGLTRRLVGVLIFAGRIINQHSPDVFIHVINNTYHTWIQSNINLHSQNQILLNRHYPPNQYRNIQHQPNQEPHSSH